METAALKVLVERPICCIVVLKQINQRQTDGTAFFPKGFSLSFEHSNSAFLKHTEVVVVFS